MAAPHYSRTYRRFPLHVPVIFGGAPCVGEGTLLNLSVMGCSIMTDQAVLCGSDVRVSLLLPGHDSALSIELGKVKWVKGYEFGVEFVRMPLESRQRLNNRLRTELIEWLQIRRQTGEWPDRLRSTD